MKRQNKTKRQNRMKFASLKFNFLKNKLKQNGPFDLVIVMKYFRAWRGIS